jgi:hypothetical protein
MAAAVVAAIVGTILMPRDQRLLPPWVIPVVEGILLVALIAGDPGAFDRRSRVLRGALDRARIDPRRDCAGGDGAAHRRPHHGRPADELRQRPARGGLDCLGRQHPRLRAALLGARRRWRGSSRPRHARLRRLRLPAADDPELAPADWRPRFVDYLYLAFTNATAFSPTDAMPIAHRAKLGMLVQSLASLAILGLVIARAVNVLA